MSDKLHLKHNGRKMQREELAKNLNMKPKFHIYMYCVRLFIKCQTICSRSKVV